MSQTAIDRRHVLKVLSAAGVGSAVFLEAEDTARRMGAKNAALDTFEWQGPGFYAKHGYVEAGRIEGYAGDYFLLLLAKAL